METASRPIVKNADGLTSASFSFVWTRGSGGGINHLGIFDFIVQVVSS